MTAPSDHPTECDQGDERLIRRAFEAYNEQDQATLLALVSSNVVWAGDDGAKLRGKDELRAYWVRQWQKIRTEDRVTDVSRHHAGHIVAMLDQTVRARDGRVLSTGSFRYDFLIADGLIRALLSKQAITRSATKAGGGSVTARRTGRLSSDAAGLVHLPTGSEKGQADDPR